MVPVKTETGPRVAAYVQGFKLAWNKTNQTHAADSFACPVCHGTQEMPWTQVSMPTGCEAGA